MANMVEESPYVLATCAACGVIHSESAPHSYRYVDDIAFFDEHLLRDPLSMEPIFNPVCLAPPCRHTFSKETIEIAIRQHGCCPLDRTPQTLANVIPAPYLVQNLLDKIRVLCPNNCSDEAISRCLLPRHLLTCPLTLLSCQRGCSRVGHERESCNQRIRLCDAVAHSAVCEYRTIACSKGCGKMIAAKYLTSHTCADTTVASKPPATPTRKRSRSVPVALKQNVGKLQWAWGSIGSDNSQFQTPSGITLSSNDKEIFIVDKKNHRVQVFNRRGEYLRKWGELGKGNGNLNNPHNIAISHLTGEVFVCDGGNSRVQVFDHKGNYIREWGSHGQGDGQFGCCYGIAISRRQEIYVSDVKSNRIQVFTRFGEFVRQFGSPGSSDGEFMGARGMSISNIDELFVVDTDNHRVQVFGEDGVYLRAFGPDNVEGGKLDGPSCVAVHGAEDKVYVTDTGNKRVAVFSTTGVFITSITPTSPVSGEGTGGEGGDSLQSPNCLAISSCNGDIFVSDDSTCRIQVFVG